MPKPLKILLLSFAAIPIILVICIGIFFIVVDPNNYKQDIENQAKQKAGVNLSIKGELSWSLLPLGININDLQILDQDLMEFASVKQLLAHIDLASIFEGKPKVETILIDGLSISLMQKSETEANWNNILPESTEKTTKETKSTIAINKSITEKENIQETKQDEGQIDDKTKLDFLIQSLEITNANLQFRSIPANQDISLKDINLLISDIALDKSVPLNLSFVFHDAVNELKVRSTISSILQISQDFNRIQVHQFESLFKISAPTLLADLNADSLDISFNTKLNVDTKTESITIEQFSTQIAKLSIQGKASIQDYSDTLKIQGELNIPAFSLKKQLAELGIALPEMQSETALSQVAFKTNFSLLNDEFTLNGIDIQLDESHWLGKLAFGLNDQSVIAVLNGDDFNVDHYLPPQSQTSDAIDTDNENSTQDPAPDTSNTPLLPLETIRTLNLDLTLSQESLIAHTIETTDITLKIEAKNGRLSLSDFSGQLHKGRYAFSAVVDASSNNPTWSAKQSIKNIDIGALIAALPEVKALNSSYSISGQLNFEGNQRAKGNTLKTLNESANVTADFNILNGAIEGISLNAYACQGFSYLSRKSVNTDNWPQSTPFTTLKGNITLKNQIANTDLNIVTTGLHVDSDGSINLKESKIDIKAGLRVVGELSAGLIEKQETKACKVNDKLKDIVIPIRCRGSFDTPPSELCGLHTSRLDKSLAKVAKKEVKRKANKEIDKALDKHLGKNADKIKDAAKNLFKKFW